MFSLEASSRLGRIKGAAFREFIAWYSATHGRERLRAHLAAMPSGFAAELDADGDTLGILTSQWYAAELVHALLDEIARGQSDATLYELGTAGSRAVMSATLSGLYRVLFQWMASPERYARYAPKLWGSYYDSGELDVQVMDDARGAISSVKRWRSHHRVICELNRGAALEIYAAMGCSQVTCERLACVDRGDTECRFVTRWTSVG
jgi:predicted hydrocarbon binding protein